MADQPNPPQQALTVFWLGMTGLLLSLAGIGLLLALPVVVYGHLTLRMLKRQECAAGRGLATTGLIAAYFGVVLGLVVAVSIPAAYRSYVAVASPQLDHLACAMPGEVAALTQDRKMWAWAMAGLITECNRERHDLLGGSPRDAACISELKTRLSDGWGVHDRESLLNTLQWLEEEGHRHEFRVMGEQISRLSPDALMSIKTANKSNLELVRRIEIVSRQYKSLGPKSLYGWDYARYISLCGWGYVAGYLTETEAWQRILPAAMKLHATFDSWNDLGQNYLIGREFWSLKQTQASGGAYEAAYARLCTTPSSPWRKYPWNMMQESATAPH